MRRAGRRVYTVMYILRWKGVKNNSARYVRRVRIALLAGFLAACSSPSPGVDADAPDSGSRLDAPDAGPDSCEARPFFSDADRDGWGAGEPLLLCAPAPGWVEAVVDCAPLDARTFPGQSAFGGTAGGAGFDFDCDGVEERELAAVYPCETGPETCRFPPDMRAMAWDGVAPACGEEGAVLLRCELVTRVDGTMYCAHETAPLQQRCR